MKILVPLSGGKDSQAALIWAVNSYGRKSIQAVFCDTGWEHEYTYKHIKYICETLLVELVVLKSDKYDDFVDLAVKKKRFPSVKARFCTEELKTKPMIDYILDVVKDDVLIIQGIRADESEARSKMQSDCRLFRYYFEPYNITKKGKKQYHTYRKKDVVRFRKEFADDIIRPMFLKTANWVIQFVMDNGQRLNPLYFKGSKRVGCYPCIMCTKGELKAIQEHEPSYERRLIDAEAFINRLAQRSNFFGPGYIPAQYCKKTYIKTDKKTGKKKRVGIPTAIEVFNYIRLKFSQTEMKLEKKPKGSCMSYYSICE